jgi:hypothetical protein
VKLVAAAMLFVAAALPAQDVTQMSVTAAEGSPVTKAALTTGMILAAASGAQILKSPEAWPRTVGGYGQRVADQAGFYVVQTITFRSVASVLDYRPDGVLCPRSNLLSCSVVSTFTAFNRVGQRRANWPLITSILAGTGASLAWRPERKDNAKAWHLVGTRIGIGVGGYVAERFVVDWWAQRKR